MRAPAAAAPEAIPVSRTPLRLEYRDPEELAENPRNWKHHPPEQMTALAEAMGEVGWAGALLYNETTGRLLDGHARRELAIREGGAAVPVLVGSWDERQEALILATLDPLAALAQSDRAGLNSLLAEIGSTGQALTALLESTATRAAEEELRRLARQPPAAPTPAGGQGEGGPGTDSPPRPFSVAMDVAGERLLRAAIARAKVKFQTEASGDALAELCREWLDDNPEAV